MSAQVESWEPCTGLFKYSELSARFMVVFRNRRDGGLFHRAVGCRDHWHLVDKRGRVDGDV